MKACFFLGHCKVNYRQYKEQIKVAIFNMIEMDGVNQFYTTGLKGFDEVCAELVDEVRKEQGFEIRNTLVCLHRRDMQKELPKHYDDCVYLLKKRVPHRRLLAKVRREIIKRSEVIYTGLLFPYLDGLAEALRYAKTQKKSFDMLNWSDTDEELERSKRAAYFKLFGKEMES